MQPKNAAINSKPAGYTNKARSPGFSSNCSRAAITRARRRCTILHAANRRIYGQWSSSIPSRFIAELPAGHVNVETTLTGGASLWRSLGRIPAPGGEQVSG